LTPRQDGRTLGLSGCRHADEFDCGRPDPPTSSASAMSETTRERRRMVLARFGRPWGAARVVAEEHRSGDVFGDGNVKS
jgi:hypothetical protein